MTITEDIEKEYIKTEEEKWVQEPNSPMFNYLNGYIAGLRFVLRLIYGSKQIK